MSEEAAPGHIELVSDIVSSFVSHNNVRPADLPDLIKSIHGTLSSFGKPAEPEPVKLTPLMPIKKTITPDAIISLEDGRPYKSLKRHLTGRGLTPQQYREKWGLPPNYPMVAASYAASRSELAKQIGLGQSRKPAAEKRAASDAKVSARAEPKKGRGRPRKADS
ncbi:transcriptional regulator, MucR family [Methylobacterium sp. 4-46]|uniref:MucR family transcriptional regulator n=1 Tax=unclassified Methylobacterium TaxID=2615210 RepID=UPI000152D76D|nr:MULTISPECIES: MucR family transcriptional regulator [Methylobacterium]ACA17744.1 transcriptional regulator, MucR family [Methylobacterium sp. 4-46]WFT83413.1 MucR family transcriptional regulator [Methylobacterium nodulans]